MQVPRILSRNWALLIGSSFRPGAEVWACQLIVLPEEKVEGGCSWFRGYDALTLSTQATGAPGMEFPLCEDTIVLHMKKSCIVKRSMKISLQMEKPPWMFSRFPHWISWYLAISLLSWRSVALRAHPFRGGTHYRQRKGNRCLFLDNHFKNYSLSYRAAHTPDSKVLLCLHEWVFRHVLFDLLNTQKEKETEKYKDLRKERWQTGVEIRGMNCSRTK